MSTDIGKVAKNIGISYIAGCSSRAEQEGQQKLDLQ